MTTYLKHGEDVVVPETPISEVYLRNVAEQFFSINFTEDEVILEVA